MKEDCDCQRDGREERGCAWMIFAMLAGIALCRALTLPEGP